MPTATLTCPECDAVLRVATRPAPGKKVKCPKCSAVFVVPAEEEVAEETPQAKPKVRANGKPPARVAAKPLPRRAAAEDDEEEEKPVGRKPARAVRPDVEEDEAEEHVSSKPVKAGRRMAVEDNDEEEDKGAVKRRPKKKAKKATKSSKGMVVLLAVAGGLFVLVLGSLAFGAFVWPGFLGSSENKGTGNEDPLAYIPAEHTIVVGFRPDDLNRVGILTMVQKKAREDSNSNDFFDSLKKEAGLGWTDFEQMVMSTKAPDTTLAPPGGMGGPSGGPMPGGRGGMGPPSGPSKNSTKSLFIIKTKAPFKAGDVVKAAKSADKQKHEGKIWYKLTPAKDGDLTGLFMPNNQLIIVTNLAEEQFKPVIAANGTQPMISADFLASVHNVDKSSVWIAASGIGGASPFGDLSGVGGAKGGPTPKGMEMSAQLDGSGATLRIAFRFADEKAAKDMATGLQLAWDIGIKAQLMAKNPAPKIAALKAALGDKATKEIVDGVRIAAQGDAAEVTCPLSKDAVDNVVKLMEKELNQPPAGGPNGGFGPGGPGGPPGGGFGPGGPGGGGPGGGGPGGGGPGGGRPNGGNP